MSRWHRLAEIAKVFVPLVVATVNPKLAPLGQTIADGITVAETIPGASNTEKLQHVQELAMKTATGLNQSGKTHIDVNGLDAAVSEVVAKSITVIKAVHPTVDPTVRNDE